MQQELLTVHNKNEKPSMIHPISSPDATSDASVAAWTCRVCTFLNHPQLVECEMCSSLCIPLETNIQDTESGQHLESKLGRTLRVLSVPSTFNILHKRDPPSHGDFLVSATNAFQSVKESWTKRRSRTTSALALKPSLQAIRGLTELHKDLTQKLVVGDEWLEMSLERLWRGVKDRENTQVFDRTQVDWVALGFQNANPETDFRGGGVLALKCLLYALEAHPAEMKAMYEEQTPNTQDGDHRKQWYPVCVAGINVTCLLAGLLHLGDGQYSERREVFWQLFEEPAAFYELFFHAFVKMNAIWHHLNATYMEFGVVLKVTRKSVILILNQAPATLMDLREASDQPFIYRFIVSLSSRSLADWEDGEYPDPYHTLETEDNLVLAKTRPK